MKLTNDKPIIILGDIHGRTIWEEVINRHPDCKIIFLGDYFDNYKDYTIQQEKDNFLEIVEYKKSRPEDVCLLIGNHDYHYIFSGEHYSGFSKNKFNKINSILLENYEYLDLACSIENEVLCVHAGVSAKWIKYLQSSNFSYEFIDCESEYDFLSKIKSRKYLLQFYCRFMGLDDTGDSPESGPLWIRPRSFSKTLISYNDKKINNHKIYVVGHTRSKDDDGMIVPTVYHLGLDMPSIVLNDALPYGYIVLENGEIKPVKI